MNFHGTDNQNDACVFQDTATADKAALDHLASRYVFRLSFRVEPAPRGLAGYSVKVWPSDQHHAASGRYWLCQNSPRSKRIKESEGDEIIVPTEPPAIFIPLRQEWFDAFLLGKKRDEWRRYGGIWNENTLYPGRKVTLTNGYGWPRLPGIVRDFERLTFCNEPAFEKIYPGWIAGGGEVARTGIDITGKIQFKPRKQDV